MSVKKLSRAQLTTAYASLETVGLNLGEIYVEPATTNEGPKAYKLVQYDDGTGNVTCTSHDVLVVYNNTTTGIINPNVYTADKTNFLRGTGKLTGISMCPFTATNKYGFVQVYGETYSYAATTSNVDAGNPLAVSAAGSDKELETLLSTISAPQTLTTNDIIQLGGDVWGYCRESVASALSKQKCFIYGHGFF